MTLSFPASRGQSGERRPELGASVPQTGETGEVVSPEGALAKQNRVLWGSGWVSCYVLRAPAGAPAVQLRSVASSGQVPGASLSLSRPHTDQKSQFQGRSSYRSAGCCRDFCSGVLWFSVSASLSNFAGSGLPCDLISLMGLSGVADFQPVQLFTC